MKDNMPGWSKLLLRLYRKIKWVLLVYQCLYNLHLKDCDMLQNLIWKCMGIHIHVKEMYLKNKKFVWLSLTVLSFN